MAAIIDVHDLPEEEINLIQKFVEFLRKESKSGLLFKEEKAREAEWNKLAISSFLKDWENEKDAIYDNWKEHYHVQ